MLTTRISTEHPGHQAVAAERASQSQAADHRRNVSAVPAASVAGMAGQSRVRGGRVRFLRSWGEKYRLLVFTTDFVVIVGVMVITYLFRYGDDTVPGFKQLLEPLFVAAAWFALLSATESRSLKHVGIGLTEYRRVIRASFYAFGAIAIGSYLLRADVSRFYFVVALPVGVGWLLLSRWRCRTYLGRLRAKGRALTRAVVIGRPSQIDETVQEMLSNPAAGYLPVAVSVVRSAGSEPPRTDLPQLPYENLHERLADSSALTDGCIGAVVVAGGLSRHDTRRLSWGLDGDAVELLIIPRIADVAGPRIQVRTLEGLGLMQVGLPRYSGWNYHVKRVFDVVFSSVALVLLSPVLLVIVIAIKLDSRGPVIFRQERVGLGGEPFVIHKFRSMATDAEARLDALRSESIGNGALFKMEDDPRTTRVGRVLRRLSLDELPQFWTALRGDMSVVGPRPHLEQELAAFPAAGLRRLLIKPGITGLWQVNGRSDLSLEESIRLDLSYVDNWSLSGDLAIILRTVCAMLKPRGAF